MNKKFDLTNKKFDRLTVISFNRTKNRKIMWNCVCDCGNESVVLGTSLRIGKTRSCGCLSVEKVIERSTSHGMCKCKEYESWVGIKKRCTNKNSKDYKNYGGRGIKICERWLNSFENFYEDMGKKPTNKHSLDRIDNNKGYSKDNCRWATRKQQNRNTRMNVFYEFRGKKRTLVEISEITGINRTTIWYRINKHGWSEERAFSVK